MKEKKPHRPDKEKRGPTGLSGDPTPKRPGPKPWKVADPDKGDKKTPEKKT